MLKEDIKAQPVEPRLALRENLVAKVMALYGPRISEDEKIINAALGVNPVARVQLDVAAAPEQDNKGQQDEIKRISAGNARG